MTEQEPSMPHHKKLTIKISKFQSQGWDIIRATEIQFHPIIITWGGHTTQYKSLGTVVTRISLGSTKQTEMQLFQRLSELLRQYRKTVLTTSHFLLHGDVRWFLQCILSSTCPICDTLECFCSAEDVARQLHEDCKASVEAIISSKSSVLLALTYLET